MKRMMWFIIGGAVIGSALASWLAPKGIAWYFNPPVNIGIDCRSATEWAMAKLQIFQLVGLLFGGGAGLLAGLSQRKRRPIETHEENVEVEP